MDAPASLDYEDSKFDPSKLDWSYVCIRTYEGEIIHTKYSCDDSVSQDMVILWHPIRITMIEDDSGSYKAGYSHYEYFSDDVIFYLSKNDIRMMSTLSDSWIKGYIDLVPKVFGSDNTNNTSFPSNTMVHSSSIH